MALITFYGGVNEIGGNKILLEDKKTRVFFDFGQSFAFGSEYFTGWLPARKINGLKDYFEFDPLPRLSGVYSKENLESINLKYTKPSIDAVFCEKCGRQLRETWFHFFSSILRMKV